MKNITKTKFSCQRNGLTIRGCEYRPQGDNLPIAIISHGFMANKNMCKQYAEKFAQMGYASYIFDFCGGCLLVGKSDGKTTDMSVLTETEDLKTVIEYVKSLSYVNPNNITLMGCSQGGFVSALVAAELKDEINSLVLFYPALCIPDDARAGKMMFAKFDPNNPPETFHCGPMKLGRQYITDVIGMNPFEKIAPYTGNVLLVHGTADKIVNLRYAEEAERTYKEREQGTITFHIIEKAKHMFSKKHDKIAMGYLEKFINKHS